MEKMKILTYEEMLRINDEAEKLEEDINLKFMGKEYEYLYQILCLDVNKKLAEQSQHIYILYIMFQLFFAEVNLRGKSCLEGKSTSQLIRIYRILSLYFRRIELDFPREKQIEITDYIKQERLSLEMMMGVISKNETIVYKQKVIDLIKELI